MAPPRSLVLGTRGHARARARCVVFVLQKIVRSRAGAMAMSRGFAVEVAGASPGWFSVHLHGVDVRPIGVTGIHAEPRSHRRFIQRAPACASHRGAWWSTGIGGRIAQHRPPVHPLAGAVSVDTVDLVHVAARACDRGGRIVARVAWRRRQR